MNNKHKYLLLEIVFENGNVKRLKHEGLSFKEIANLTNTLINENLIIYQNDLVKLSKLGIEKHLELQPIYKEVNKDKWIEKENDSKIERLDTSFIYLPNQSEIHF